MLGRTCLEETKEEFVLLLETETEKSKEGRAEDSRMLGDTQVTMWPLPVSVPPHFRVQEKRKEEKALKGKGEGAQRDPVSQGSRQRAWAPFLGVMGDRKGMLQRYAGNRPQEHGSHGPGRRHQHGLGGRDPGHRLASPGRLSSVWVGVQRTESYLKRSL